ncbi:MAG: hypothetical protein JWO08_4104, partial [Verrucomicrobiaceae bacterium]|nr:hypothetical protein [Verrucomicrobiaceae bacterium]
MSATFLHVASVFCAFGVSASGASYYVSTAGSNANPGTLALPLRNIQTAINAAVAGDTIYVRALTAGGAQQVFSERLTFSGKNGTAPAPISLRNYAADVNGDGSPAYPAIDQTGVIPPNDVSALLSITNCSYITVEGLEFRNYETTDEAKTPAGIYISGSGTGLQLIRNKVHHIYQSNAVLYNADANGFGVAVYGTASAAIDQLVFEGNEIYDLRTGQSESVTINGNVTNFQVINNQVHDGNNIGIDFIGYEQPDLSDTVDFARNGVVRGNQVYNIDSQFNPGYGGNFTGTFGTQADRNSTRSAPGIYVDGGASITVEGNDVHDCNIGMSFSSEALNKVTASCLIRDNLIRHNQVGGLFLGGAGLLNGGTQNCAVSNNTFYQNDTEDYGGGSLSIQHFVTGTTVRQNLFVCGPTSKQFILKTSTDGSFGANAINWNLYSGTASNDLEFIWNGISQGSFSSWQAASSQDASSLFVASASSLFAVNSPVNAVDFALKLSSPAVNAGDPTFTSASGEADYFEQSRVTGGRVDIGMAEWTSGPEITVEQPAGTPLLSGSGTVDFGIVVVPNNSVRTFTIKNTGAADLTGLAVTTDGTNAADYTPGALGSTTVAAGASTTFTVTFAPSAEGTRSARLLIASNDADEALFTIKLTGLGQLAPHITSQPLPKTVNPNTTVTFTVAATGTLPLSYQWRKDTMDIPGATSASYTIAHALESDQGGYSVVVTNPAGTATSNTVQLSVNDPVTLSGPQSQSASVGTTVTLSVGAGGTAPFTYQWWKNGVAIAGATSSSYVIPNVQLAHSGTYFVVVKNIVGSRTSANAILSLADTAPKYYKLPTGGTAIMTGSFAGAITSYAWMKNGGPLPGDSRYSGGATKTLTITGLRLTMPDDSGTYTCTGTIASGNLTTTAILIVYGSKPEIPLPAGVPHTIVMPPAMVADTYVDYQIPFDSDPQKTPTSFATTGLPAGLKLNTATGEISGKPSVALLADKEYAVRFTVS